MLFEVELPGFNAETDETDDLILWVEAKSMDLVHKAYPHAQDIQPLPFGCPTEDLDAIL